MLHWKTHTFSIVWESLVLQKSFNGETVCRVWLNFAKEALGGSESWTFDLLNKNVWK